jgi:hypothetical protein
MPSYRAFQDYSTTTEDFIKWKKAIRREQLEKLVEEPQSPEASPFYNPKSEIKKSASSYERKSYL